MLHVYLGDHPDSIYDTATYFDMVHEDEWFEDPIVKQMILDIDKSEVVGPNLIISPVLGPIPPTYLSGGVKTLILMLKQEAEDGKVLIWNANNCGNNCSNWIQRIGDMKDITISLEYFMDWFTGDCSSEFVILNDNSVVHSEKEFVYKAIEYLIENRDAEIDADYNKNSGEGGQYDNHEK